MLIRNKFLGQQMYLRDVQEEIMRLCNHIISHFQTVFFPRKTVLFRIHFTLFNLKMNHLSQHNQMDLTCHKNLAVELTNRSTICTTRHSWHQYHQIDLQIWAMRTPTRVSVFSEQSILPGLQTISNGKENHKLLQMLSWAQCILISLFKQQL